MLPTRGKYLRVSGTSGSLTRCTAVSFRPQSSLALNCQLLKWFLYNFSNISLRALATFKQRWTISLIKRSWVFPDAYFHERRSLNNFHRDRVITAFFKVVVAWCNKITVMPLLFLDSDKLPEWVPSHATVCSSAQDDVCELRDKLFLALLNKSNFCWVEGSDHASSRQRRPFRGKAKVQNHQLVHLQ